MPLVSLSQLLMSVFENAMKSHNVLENDPYDWEKCDSEDMLTITAAATTAQQLTRLTPAYLGYLHLKKTPLMYNHLVYNCFSLIVKFHFCHSNFLRTLRDMFSAFFRLEICTVRDPSEITVNCFVEMSCRVTFPLLLSMANASVLPGELQRENTEDVLQGERLSDADNCPPIPTPTTLGGDVWEEMDRNRNHKHTQPMIRKVRAM